jgi:hypothetical protein
MLTAEQQAELGMYRCPAVELGRPLMTSRGCAERCMARRHPAMQGGAARSCGGKTPGLVVEEMRMCLDCPIGLAAAAALGVRPYRMLKSCPRAFGKKLGARLVDNDLARDPRFQPRRLAMLQPMRASSSD